MLRRIAMLVVAALAAWPLATGAAGAGLDDALKLVPGSAHVVAGTPGWQTLGKKVKMVAGALGLADRIPPGGDLTPLVAAGTGLKLDQLDPAGAVLVVIPELPAEDGLAPKLAVLLPVRNYQAFATDNAAQTKDGRVTISAGCGTLHLGQVGPFACLAEDGATLATLGRTERPLAETLTPDELELARSGDLFIHVNARAVYGLLRPRIEKELREGPAAGTVRTVMEYLQAVGPDADSLHVVLAASEEGLDLRALLTARDDSAMGRAFAGAAKPPGPLVAGVPTRNLLLAAGVANVLDPDGEFSARLAEVAAKTSATGGVDLEQALRVVEHARKLTGLVRRKSVSLVATGREGRPALPVTWFAVLETTDGPAAGQAARAYLTELAKAMSARLSELAPRPAAGASEPPAAPAVTFKEQAETIGGLKVDKLVFRTDALAPLLGEGALLLPRILGDPETALRVGVKGNSLVATVGGGPAAFEEALKAADASTAPDDESGVPKAQTRLLPGACAAVWLPADRLGNLVLAVVSDILDVPAPAAVKVGEPVVGSFAFKGRTVQGRLFVPMELLEAGRRFVEELRLPGAPATQPASAPD